MQATTLSEATDSQYTTQSVWAGKNNHTLVVDCSDPRLSEARTEFLASQRKILRYDSIVVPGGPANMICSSTSYFAERERIKLLHGLHGFKLVIGIAHHDCGYYKHKRPNTSDADRQKEQIDDLEKFVEEMKAIIPEASVEIFFAEPEGGGCVQYRKVLRAK